MVKRYWWVEDGMEEFERGDFVFYPDYLALAERCERLEAALRALVESADNVAHGYNTSLMDQNIDYCLGLLAESSGAKK